MSDAFRQIFDVALVEAHEQLVAAPGDLTAKVRFVTLYHLVLEGTLGLTSFKFITDYLNDNGLLPGFVDGLLEDPPRRDAPHRLRRLVPARDRPRPSEQADAVRATLRELAAARRRLAQAARTTATPPSLLGVSEDDLRAFALDGLTRRLSIIGVPLETVFA